MIVSEKNLQEWNQVLEFGDEKDYLGSFIRFYKMTHRIRDSYKAQCKFSKEQHEMKVQYYSPKNELGNIKEYFLIQKCFLCSRFRVYEKTIHSAPRPIQNSTSINGLLNGLIYSGLIIALIIFLVFFMN